MTEANIPTADVKSDKQKESDNKLVISFLALRNLIGISGMLLPIVLTLFTPKGEQDKVMEHSISEYYYTKNGDLFVVLLSVIGVFLLTYKGYDRFLGTYIDFSGRVLWDRYCLFSYSYNNG